MTTLTARQRTLVRFVNFNHEFKKESDRGCAVLVMCALEEMLREVFASFVVESEVKNLTKIIPKGGVDRALAVAKILGLLWDEEIRCYRILAKIRNDFAHKALEDLSFESPIIKDQVAQLKPVLPFVESELKAKSTRNQFLTHAFLMHSALWHRIERSERRTKPGRLTTKA